MSIEQDKLRGREARALLDNPLHKDAVKALNEYIEHKALTVDPNNEKAAQVILITKQIAKAYIREFEKLIQNGQVAEIRIDQMEEQKRFKVFNRGY
jgi:hypothetical protein